MCRRSHSRRFERSSTWGLLAAPSSRRLSEIISVVFKCSQSRRRRLCAQPTRANEHGHERTSFISRIFNFSPLGAIHGCFGIFRQHPLSSSHFPRCSDGNKCVKCQIFHPFVTLIARSIPSLTLNHRSPGSVGADLAALLLISSDVLFHGTSDGDESEKAAIKKAREPFASSSSDILTIYRVLQKWKSIRDSGAYSVVSLLSNVC
jgi:hypothetical protein